MYTEYDNITLDEAAEIFDKVSKQLDAAAAEKTQLQNRYDHLRRVVLPKLFEAADLTGGKFSSINRGIRIQDELFVSVAEGQQPALLEWLSDHGEGDIIKPTVNPSTLKALVSRAIKEGGEYPSDHLKVTIIPTARFY